MVRILNIVGLIFGIAGTFIMYHFSPKINSQLYLFQDEEMKEIRRLDKFKNKMVRIGMLLLFISFLFQFAALLISD